MLLEVFKILARFLLPILLIILGLTVVNIILNCKKYGTKIFASFKKYNSNGKMRDLAIDMLKNQSHKSVLIVNRDDNSFYAITHYAVFAIYVFDNNDSISGNINDRYLKCNNIDILNPIPKFLNDNNNIKNAGINLECIYINAKKDVKLNINNFNEKFYTLNDFYYKLYSNQHTNIKYSFEEATHLKNIIEDVIYGNNKN